jgi:hypothetical protein
MPNKWHVRKEGKRRQQIRQSHVSFSFGRQSIGLNPHFPELLAEIAQSGFSD